MVGREKDETVDCSDEGEDDGGLFETSGTGAFPFSSRFWFMPMYKSYTIEQDLLEEKLRSARLYTLAQGWPSKLRVHRMTEDLSDAGISIRSAVLNEASGDLVQLTSCTPASGAARKLAWDRESNTTSVRSRFDELKPDAFFPEAEDLRVDTLMGKSSHDFFVNHLCDQSSSWSCDFLMPIEISALLTKKAFTSTPQQFGKLTVVASIELGVDRHVDPPLKTKKKSKKGAQQQASNEKCVSVRLVVSPPGGKCGDASHSQMWSVPLVHYEAALVSWKDLEDESHLSWGLASLSHLRDEIVIPSLTKLSTLTPRDNRGFTGGKKATAIFRFKLCSRFSDPIRRCMVPGDYIERRKAREAKYGREIFSPRKLTQQEMESLACRLMNWSPFTWTYESPFSEEQGPQSNKDKCTAVKTNVLKKARRLRCWQTHSGLFSPETMQRRGGKAGAFERFPNETALNSKQPLIPQLSNLMPWHQIGIFGGPGPAWTIFEPVLQATLSSGILRMLLVFTKGVEYRTVVETLRQHVRHSLVAMPQPSDQLRLCEDTLRTFGITGDYLHSHRGGPPVVENGNSTATMCLPELLEMGTSGFKMPTLSVLLVATVKEALEVRRRQPSRRISRKWIFRILKLVAEIKGLRAALEIFDLQTVVQCLRPCVVDAMEDCSIFFQVECKMNYPRDMLRNCLFMDLVTVVKAQESAKGAAVETVLESTNGYGLTFDLDWREPNLESMLKTLHEGEYFENYLLPSGRESGVCRVSQITASPVEFTVDFVSKPPALCAEKTRRYQSFTVPEYLDCNCGGKQNKDVYALMTVLAVIPKTEGALNGGRTVCFMKDEITGLWETCSSEIEGVYPMPQTRQYIEAMSKVGKRKHASTRGKEVDPRGLIQGVQHWLNPAKCQTEAGSDVPSIFDFLPDFPAWNADDTLSRFGGGPYFPAIWAFNPGFVPLQVTYGRVEYLSKFNAYWQPRGRTLSVIPFFFDQSKLEAKETETAGKEEPSKASMVRAGSKNSVANLAVEVPANPPQADPQHFALSVFNFEEGIDIACPDSRGNVIFQESATGRYDWTLTAPTLDTNVVVWKESSFPPVHISPVLKEVVKESLEADIAADELNRDALEDMRSLPPSDEELSVSEASLSETETPPAADREIPPELTWNSWFDGEAPTLAEENDQPYIADNDDSTDSEGTLTSMTRDHPRPFPDDLETVPPIIASKVAESREISRQRAKRLAEEGKNASRKDGDQEQIIAVQQAPENLIRNAIAATFYKSNNRFAADLLEEPSENRTAALAVTMRSGERKRPCLSEVVDIYLLDEAQFFDSCHTKAIRRILSRQAREVAEKLEQDIDQDALSESQPRWLECDVLKNDNFETSMVFRSCVSWMAGEFFGDQTSTISASQCRWENLPITMHLHCARMTEFRDLALLLTLLHRECVENSAFYALKVDPPSPLAGNSKDLCSVSFVPMQPRDIIDRFVIEGDDTPAWLKVDNSLNRPRIFVVAFQKPGSILCAPFINVLPTARKLATVTLSDTMKHAHEVVNSMPMERMPSTRCDIEDGTVLLMIRYFDPLHFGMIYLGSLMAHRDRELIEFHELIALAAEKKTREILTLRREVLHLLKRSPRLTPAERETVDDLEQLINSTLKNARFDLQETELMIFLECPDGFLVPLPQKFTPISQIFAQKTSVNIVVQPLTPGNHLCMTCRKAIPAETAAARDYGCCSEDCEIVIRLAEEVKQFLPKTLNSVCATPEVVTVIGESKVCSDLYGDFARGGVDDEGRPFWDKWSAKGRRRIQFNSRHFHWEIVGSSGIDTLEGPLAVSEKAVFSVSPADLPESSNWFAADGEGFNPVKGMRVVASAAIQEAPDHMALGYGNNGVLGMYRRLRAKVEGRPSFVRTPEHAGQECFSRTAMHFDSTRGNWVLSVVSDMSTPIFPAVVGRKLDELTRSAESWTEHSPALASWANVPEQNSTCPRLVVEGIHSHLLWRPILLTVISNIPSLPSGEYLLPKNAVDATYHYAASPNASPESDFCPRLLLRILDLAGLIICFAPSTKHTRESLLLKFDSGERHDGYWKRAFSTAQGVEVSSRKDQRARIIAMSELPSVVHVVSQGRMGSLRGTYFLLSRLFNFRPVYFRMNPMEYADKLKDHTPPIDPEVLDAMCESASHVPPVFLYFSSTSESWRFGSVCGAGEAICETKASPHSHHPATLVSRVSASGEECLGAAAMVSEIEAGLQSCNVDALFSTRAPELAVSDKGSRYRLRAPPYRFFSCVTGDHTDLLVLSLPCDSTINTSRLTHFDESPLQSLAAFPRFPLKQSCAAIADKSVPVTEPQEWLTDTEGEELEGPEGVECSAAPLSKLEEDLPCNLQALKKRRLRSAIWDRFAKEHILMPRELSVGQAIKRRFKRIGRAPPHSQVQALMAPAEALDDAIQAAANGQDPHHRGPSFAMSDLMAHSAESVLKHQSRVLTALNEAPPESVLRRVFESLEPTGGIGAENSSTSAYGSEEIILEFDDTPSVKRSQLADEPEEKKSTKKSRVEKCVAHTLPEPAVPFDVEEILRQIEPNEGNGGKKSKKKRKKKKAQKHEDEEQTDLPPNETAVTTTSAAEPIAEPVAEVSVVQKDTSDVASRQEEELGDRFFLLLLENGTPGIASGQFACLVNRDTELSNLMRQVKQRRMAASEDNKPLSFSALVRATCSSWMGAGTHNITPAPWGVVTETVFARLKPLLEKQASKNEQDDLLAKACEEMPFLTLMLNHRHFLTSFVKAEFASAVTMPTDLIGATCVQNHLDKFESFLSPEEVLHFTLLIAQDTSEDQTWPFRLHFDSSLGKIEVLAKCGIKSKKAKQPGLPKSTSEIKDKQDYVNHKIGELLSKEKARRESRLTVASEAPVALMATTKAAKANKTKRQSVATLPPGVQTNKPALRNSQIAKPAPPTPAMDSPRSQHSIISRPTIIRDTEHKEVPPIEQHKKLDAMAPAFLARNSMATTTTAESERRETPSKTPSTLSASRKRFSRSSPRKRELFAPDMESDHDAPPPGFAPAKQPAERRPAFPPLGLNLEPAALSHPSLRALMQKCPPMSPRELPNDVPLDRKAQRGYASPMDQCMFDFRSPPAYTSRGFLPNHFGLHSPELLPLTSAPAADYHPSKAAAHRHPSASELGRYYTESELQLLGQVERIWSDTAEDDDSNFIFDTQSPFTLPPRQHPAQPMTHRDRFW